MANAESYVIQCIAYLYAYSHPTVIYPYANLYLDSDAKPDGHMHSDAGGRDSGALARSDTASPARSQRARGRTGATGRKADGC